MNLSSLGLSENAKREQTVSQRTVPKDRPDRQGVCVQVPELMSRKRAVEGLSLLGAFF